ncbi:ABC-2 family transporter protein [compost metagenome]
MFNIWTIAKYEIHRMMTSRLVLSIQFVMPLLLIFILGSALSGTFKTEESKINPVKVMLVQQDTGPMQQMLEGFLKSSEITKLIQSEEASTRDEVERMITKGEAEFALVVPAGFSSDVMAGKPANWEMMLGKDYQQNLVAKMVFNTFLSQLNQMQSAILTLGPEAAMGLVNSSAAGNTTPEQSVVKIGKLSSSNSDFTSNQYYAASMLIMFLLYSGMTGAISLMKEKERHTLARLNAMPIREEHIIIGKMSGNGFIAMLQSILIITVTSWLYDVDWGQSYVALSIVCLLLILASMSLAVIGMMFSGSSKSVSSFFQTIILVMTFLSGGFSPLPEGFLHTLGQFTINHWALQSFLRMMLHSDVSTIINKITILGAIGVGLLIISLAAFRKVGYHE